MTINPVKFVSIAINRAATPGPAFGFGVLAGHFDHDNVTERIRGPFTTIQEAQDEPLIGMVVIPKS